MSKNEVIQHRNSSHQIFLTTLALLIALGDAKTDYFLELILIISIVYDIVIFSNMYKELYLVYCDRDVSLTLMLKNQLTLILPVAFIVTALLSCVSSVSSVIYMFLIVSIWYLELIFLYYLIGGKRVEDSK